MVVPDARVDAWIEALPDWQRAICREVREIMHAVDRRRERATSAVMGA
jgi:hypothetical protein